MNNKTQEIIRLFSQYVDVLGRVTYLNRSKSTLVGPKIKYDSLNQHLWTGEAAILIAILFDKGNDAFYNKLHGMLEISLARTKIADGLYSRQPYPYVTLPKDPIEAKKLGYSAGYDSISLDEYNGIAFSCAVLDRKDIMREILVYAENNNWCFHDGFPNVNPFKQLSKKPKSFLNTLKDVISYVFKTKDVTGSNELDQIIDNDLAVELFSRVLQPKDRLILKLAGGRSGSLLDWTQFLMATLATCKPDNNETSGKILGFFRLKMLEVLGAQNCLTNLVKRIFHGRLSKKYGPNYMKEIFNAYYEDKNHPFHNLIDGVDINTEVKLKRN